MLICLKNTTKLRRLLTQFLILILKFSGIGQVMSMGEGGPSHACQRPCSESPDTRMTCHYIFSLSHYYTFTPHCLDCATRPEDCLLPGCIPVDGTGRQVLVVNYSLPGPAIRICKGDTVVVDMTNNMLSTETAIHWHGIEQRGSQWMDGVPGLTQCPIPSGATFRYQFDVPIPGTYFYHSHAALQRVDGLAGAIIVREPLKTDFHGPLYDFDLPEHEIIVQDWLPTAAIDNFLRKYVLTKEDPPSNILINGRGFPPGYLTQPENQNSSTIIVAIPEFRVEKGSRYRFRMISNGIILCPLEISVENHTLVVIEADASEIQPVETDSLVIHSGERWDFIIRADQKVGSYWFKVRGLIGCSPQYGRQIYQLGLLNYHGVPRQTFPNHKITTWDAAGPNGDRQINPIVPKEGADGTLMTLSSVNDDDPEIVEKAKADHQFYLGFDFNQHLAGRQRSRISVVNKMPNLLKKEARDMRRDVFIFPPQLNYISNVMPPFPPLTQPEMLKSLEVCSEGKMPPRLQGVDCSKTFCQCTHVLKVKLNAIVEVVLIDRGRRGDVSHPFHLHGHEFRVVANGRVGNKTEVQEVADLDAKGLINRRSSKNLVKDTVAVPDGGYTIFRFRANNPGFWLLHCHIEFHMEEGMALIFQVGDEPVEVPPNFPTCKNYLQPDKPDKSPPDPHLNFMLFFIYLYMRLFEKFVQSPRLLKEFPNFFQYSNRQHHLGLYGRFGQCRVNNYVDEHRKIKGVCKVTKMTFFDSSKSRVCYFLTFEETGTKPTCFGVRLNNNVDDCCTEGKLEIPSAVYDFVQTFQITGYIICLRRLYNYFYRNINVCVCARKDGRRLRRVNKLKLNETNIVSFIS